MIDVEALNRVLDSKGAAKSIEREYILAAGSLEHRCINARAAVEGVNATPGYDRVIAGVAVQIVIPVAAL
jgi:hypothetical protein